MSPSTTMLAEETASSWLWLCPCSWSWSWPCLCSCAWLCEWSELLLCSACACSWESSAWLGLCVCAPFPDVCWWVFSTCKFKRKSCRRPQVEEATSCHFASGAPLTYYVSQQCLSKYNPTFQMTFMQQVKKELWSTPYWIFALLMQSSVFNHNFLTLRLNKRLKQLDYTLNTHRNAHLMEHWWNVHSNTAVHSNTDGMYTQWNEGFCSSCWQYRAAGPLDLL